MSVEDEFTDEWWYGRPLPRKIFAPLLYLASWRYRFWRFLQKPPDERRKKVEKIARKLRKSIDFPRVRRSDLIGREDDLDRVLLSVHYHIFRDEGVRKVSAMPPPKLFLLKGGSGSGKTFFAEAAQREAFEAGLEHGVIVSYESLRPEQVYTMWYGSSAQRLGEFFNQAFYRPSVILIDEFQAFGKKFTSATETGMEETRVQTVFLEKIDALQKRNYRTIVLIATTEYESLLETLRRRGLVGTIDLDTGITKEMLVNIAKLQCEKFGIQISPASVVETLEDSVRSLGATELTPADVVNAFNICINARAAPLQQQAIKRLRSKEHADSEAIQKVGGLITLGDFRSAARKLKSYRTEERTEAAKRSIVRIKPRETYDMVGGLYGIKEEVIKEISLSLNPELAARSRYLPPKGFMFSGAPGTGKTLLAKAIAGENDVWFYSVNGPSILQGRYGDPEKTVRDIFEDARKNAPAIVFFDEIDSVAPKRGMYDPIVDRVTSQLLTELDGFVPLHGVVIIGSTNRLEVMDPALLERFTRHFDFTYPKNRAEKQEVIEIHLSTYKEFLDAEATLERILEVFDRRVLSPRKIADAINDANRLRTKELEACHQLVAAMREKPARLPEVRKIFGHDIERLYANLGVKDGEPGLPEVLEKVEPSNYPLRLSHFSTAVENTVDERLEEAREMIEATVRLERPEVGKSYGLVVMGNMGGLVAAIEVVVNPYGSGRVYVLGSELGESIKASAEDAFVYLNSIADWRFKNYDIYVELVTPAKGMEKQSMGLGVTVPPVAGPSAGLAIGVAMLSSLVSLQVDPSVVMTGAITTRGEVWPVGGLDYRGTGKIEAALADKYAKKLMIPTYNYERMKDTGAESMLKGRQIRIIPVQSFLDAVLEAVMGVGSREEIITLLKTATPMGAPREAGGEDRQKAYGAQGPREGLVP